MTIDKVLATVREEQPIVVRDRTFTIHHFQTVTLDTGIVVYWVRGDTGTWLSIDPESDEVIFFEDLDDELEVEDETVVYGGDDYELSYEDKAVIKDDDGGVALTIREFESSKGNVIRITENENTSDITFALGKMLTEEDLQAA